MIYRKPAIHFLYLLQINAYLETGLSHWQLLVSRYITAQVKYNRKDVKACTSCGVIFPPVVLYPDLHAYR
jgi:hypothetical protein